MNFTHCPSLVGFSVTLVVGVQGLQKNPKFLMRSRAMKNNAQHYSPLFFLLLASSTAFAGARDVKAIRINFTNVAASRTGDFPTPAHQRVDVLVRNQGTTVQGRSAACSGSGLCVQNLLEVGIKDKTGSSFMAPLAPNGQINVSIQLPANTLRHCEKINVNLFGTSSPDDEIFATSSAYLTAVQHNNITLCSPLIIIPTPRPFTESEFED
jgi:hypothetical protein